jgi:hypothetical protein
MMQLIGLSLHGAFMAVLANSEFRHELEGDVALLGLFFLIRCLDQFQC